MRGCIHHLRLRRRQKEAAKAPEANAPVKIAVTAGPHAEIMDNVKKLAEKQGLKVEVVEFNDYVTPNVALFQGEVFANSMQHRPYLDATLKKSLNLIWSKFLKPSTSRWQLILKP